MSSRVLTFYRLVGGGFGLVDIGPEDKKHIDKLLYVLRKLEVIGKTDREALMNVWKSFNRTDVRKFGEPRK